MKTLKSLLFLVALAVTMCAHAQLTITQASRALGNMNSVIASKGDTSHSLKMASFAQAIVDKDSWMKWNAKFTKVEEMLVDSGTKFVMEADGKFFEPQTVVDTVMHVRLARLSEFMPQALKGSYKNVYVPLYAFMKDETPQNLYSFAQVIDFDAQQKKLKALKDKQAEADRLAKAKAKKPSKDTTANGTKKTKGTKDTKGVKDGSTDKTQKTATNGTALDSIENIKNLWLRAFAMMKYSSDMQSDELGLPGMMWPKYEDITAVFLKHGEHGIEQATGTFRSVLTPRVDTSLGSVQTIFLDRGGKHIYLSTVPKDTTGRDLLVAWKIQRGEVVKVDTKSTTTGTVTDTRTSTSEKVSTPSGAAPAEEADNAAAIASLSRADTVGDIFRHKVLSNPGKGNFELFDPEHMPNIFNPDPKWGYLLNGETGELTHLGRNLLRRDYRLARLGLLTGGGYAGTLNDYGLYNSFGYSGGGGYYGGAGFYASAGFGFGYSSGSYCAPPVYNNCCGGYSSVVSFVGTTNDVYGTPPPSDYCMNVNGYRSVTATEEPVMQDPLAIADLQAEASLAEATTREGESVRVDVKSLQNELNARNRIESIHGLQAEANQAQAAPSMHAISSLNQEAASASPARTQSQVTNRPTPAMTSSVSNSTSTKTPPAFRPVSKLPNGEDFTQASTGARPTSNRPNNSASNSRPAHTSNANVQAARPANNSVAQQRPTARPQQARPVAQQRPTAQSRPVAQQRPTVSRPATQQRPVSRPAQQARPAAKAPARQSASAAAPSRRR